MEGEEEEVIEEEVGEEEEDIGEDMQEVVEEEDTLPKRGVMTNNLYKHDHH